MSDDLKTNYTKLNKRYQELKQQLAEKEEFLHNRDKWIAELEKQVNLSRAMERVALKGCKELEEKLKEVEGQYAYECECNKQFVECQNENEKLKQQLHELPKKIVEDFYDEIRHRAILEDDYCPDHNLERKYGVRKCLLENIRTTILKKYGDKNE